MDRACDLVRVFNFVQMFEGAIDSGEVLLDNSVTLLTVGLLNGFLDLFNGFVTRQNAGDGEEAGLHDGVDAAAHAGLLGNGESVDRVELQLLFNDGFLTFDRELVPDFFRTVNGVEEEGAALLGEAEDIQFFKEGEHVAADEGSVIFTDEIRGMDRIRAEAQVGGGGGAGLLGVVFEVALGPVVGVQTDDLDGVLVGTDGTIGTQTEEHAVHGAAFRQQEVRIVGDGLEGDVIFNTDGEVVQRAVLLHFIEDTLDHSRGEVLGAHTVAAAADDRHGLERSVTIGDGFVDSGNDIDEERFTGGTRFFGAVEDSDLLDGGRQSLDQVFDTERTIQADSDDAVLFALGGVQVFRGFDTGFNTGAHGDDDDFSVFSTVVIKQMILAAGELGEFVHGFLDFGRAFFIEFVDSFAALEEDIRVLGGTVDDRVFRVHRAGAGSDDVFVIDHRAHIFDIELFDLHDFVRSAETIEEVKERDAGFQGGALRDKGSVMRFLNRVGGDQRETGLAGGHDVGLITENGQRVRRKGAGSHMEDGGDQFTGDLVHVRDHQQKTLGSGEGGGHCTGD